MSTTPTEQHLRILRIAAAIVQFQSTKYTPLMSSNYNSVDAIRVMMESNPAAWDTPAGRAFVEVMRAKTGETDEEILYDVIKKSSIPEETIDFAIQQARANEGPLVAPAVMDAYHALKKLEHTGASAFEFLINATDERIALVPAQVEALLEVEKDLFNHHDNHQIESITQRFIDVADTLSKVNENDVSNTNNPFLNCTGASDLLSEKFKIKLKTAARYARLHHEYVEGDINSTEQRGENYKFLAELQHREILPSNGAKTLNFVRVFSDRIGNQDLGMVANCQIHEKAINPGMKDYSQSTCLRPPILTSRIKLTSDVTSYDAMMTDLRSFGVIDPATPYVLSNENSLRQDWQMVAATRVLNTSFHPQDYLSLPAPTSFFNSTPVRVIEALAVAGIAGICVYGIFKSLTRPVSYFANKFGKSNMSVATVTNPEEEGLLAPPGTVREVKVVFTKVAKTF